MATVSLLRLTVVGLSLTLKLVALNVCWMETFIHRIAMETQRVTLARIMWSVL